MEYYLAQWHKSMFESRVDIQLDENNNLYKFVKCYEGKKAIFYTETNVLSRWMYIYTGDFIQKAVLSFIEIENKCSNKSIEAAFEDCPNIYNWLKDFTQDNLSPIVVLNIDGSDYYCLKESYITFLTSKKKTFKRLCEKADLFRTEILLIKTYRLEPSFFQKAKRFFAKSAKYAIKFVVRAGVIVAASAIGANIDLPVFDFDLDLPDVDTDFDFDVDVPLIAATPDIDIPNIDTDVDVDLIGNDDIIGNAMIDISDGGDVYSTDGLVTNNYNVAFGKQQADLQKVGGGLGTKSVTITKESGSSNLFCITDGSNAVHNVKGGTSKITLNGIQYKLPKLKG